MSAAASRILTCPTSPQVLVPELELEVSTGTLGGVVTTVEGLVQAVATALKSTRVRIRLTQYMSTDRMHYWRQDLKPEPCLGRKCNSHFVC